MVYWIHWQCENCDAVHEATAWCHKKKCPECGCCIYKNVGYFSGYKNGKPVYSPEIDTRKHYIMPHEIELFEVALSPIEDDLIKNIAQDANTTEADVRDYVNSETRQDKKLFKAFERYQVFPVGKFP